MKYKVTIDTTEYTDADIQSGNIERPLFDELGIGNACMAMLKIISDATFAYFLFFPMKKVSYCQFIRSKSII